MPPMPSDIRVHGIYAVIPSLLGFTRIYRLIVINSFTNPGRERLDPAVVDMAFNSVHRIRPDGTMDLIIPNVDYPNGLAFSPDERLLYVANTRPGQYIMVYDVHADGTVSNGRHFAEMPSPDATNGVPD